MAVPSAWMPKASMHRIHVHWTAGGYAANATDKRSYHILIQGDGSLVRCDTSIKANEAGSGMKPASHTKNANTGAIGVSMCCMTGAKESPFKPGVAPLKREQWDAMIEVVADLALAYHILVTPTRILTHAEVEPNLGIPQDKWDITRLPFDPKTVGHKAVGDMMRKAVAARLSQIKGAAPPPDMPSDLKLPRFKVQGAAPSTLNVRRSPAGEKVGELPEGSVVERLAMLGNWSQVRTSAGFVGWVSTPFLAAVAPS
ncbi:N-acetylmuramoyl-L-alanine amidase [Enterovirga rhinocerotis]|uniref:SH3 domain-containing protein n=1 Tax=Enterovirga rhinocerotis TaxID=1339210 RepID=A0A4V3DYS3_9HYPH|nr:N-acetylmuramoyl-L-alanine amidase [Enterovirga rhinocerotis]TDR93179.1 SH3 domain-containing protein [Enterovirga rhinocerotis]